MERRMTNEEIEKATRIATDILRQHKPKPRRITITQDDKDAFMLIWDMYHDADSATDGTWISDDERKKIEKLHKKIFGRR